LSLEEAVAGFVPKRMFMSERLSNEHGHDESHKTTDPSSPAEPGVGPKPETPDPSGIPPNEGGTGPDEP
jgi:hypothetical protein